MMSKKLKPSVDSWKDAVGMVTHMGAAAYKLPGADKDVVGAFTGAAQQVLTSYLDMHENVAGVLLSGAKGEARDAQVSKITENGINKITAAALTLSEVCRDVADGLPGLNLTMLSHSLNALVQDEVNGSARAEGDKKFMARVKGNVGKQKGLVFNN